MEQGYKLYPVNGEYVLSVCGGTDITDMQSLRNDKCYRLEGPGLMLFKDTNCTFRVNGEDFCETGTFVHSYTTGTGYYPSVWYKKAGSKMGSNIDWAFGLNPKWNTSRVKWTVPRVYPYGQTFVVEYDGKTETWTHTRHTKVTYTADNNATLQIGNVDIHQGCNIRVKYPRDAGMDIGEYQP